MIPVGDLVSRTSNILQDEDLIRWTLGERIRWGNEAMGAILTRRPAAFAQVVTATLVAGTKQGITAAQLLDVTRNLGTDGATPGRVIRRSDRQLLDDTAPDWHTHKARAEIRQFTYDDRAPKTFYVYPPAVAGTQVETLQAVLPPAVADTAADGAFDVGFEYLESLVNYVCYRAHSKDSEFANGAVAAAFFQAFEGSLGVQTQAAVANSPNQPNNSV